MGFVDFQAVSTYPDVPLADKWRGSGSLLVIGSFMLAKPDAVGPPRPYRCEPLGVLVTQTAFWRFGGATDVAFVLNIAGKKVCKYGKGQGARRGADVGIQTDEEGMGPSWTRGRWNINYIIAITIHHPFGPVSCQHYKSPSHPHRRG